MTQQTATITETELRDRVAAHASNLAEYAEIDERYKNLMAAFNEENAELITARTEAKKLVSETDEAVRTGAMALYQSDPQAWAEWDDKAVSVALHNVAEYDPEAFYAVALERAPFLLQLDDKMIQDLAKAEISGRQYAMQKMAVSLPGLVFTKRPFVQVSEPTLIKRAGGK